MSSPPISPVGILLAAGAGRRMGTPKALVGGWLADSVRVLRDGGCDPVLVVLGAEADRARALIPDEQVVVATDWAEGMAASLRAGLRAAGQTSAPSAVIHLVDLPDVTAAVVARLTAYDDRDPQVLARATFAGHPGHPVLIGRGHWTAVIDQLTGDRGARDYLDQHQAVGIDCSDLATGADRDS